MKDAAFGALVAAFPNTGFMGAPLLVALLGPAAGPVICTALADLFFTNSLCIALARRHDAGSGRAATVHALKGALSNPLPWAIALGAAARATGLQPPAPLNAVIRMLADAASPDLTVLTLVAALPSASSVSLLAERCRADNDRVARIIMASTGLALALALALALVSFTALAGLLI